MTFISYYWDSSKLGRESEREAVRVIVDPITSNDKFRDAITTLLRGSCRARGIAFDQYSYAKTEGGQLRSDAFEGLENELLSEARAELAKEAVIEEVEGKSIVGSNHASALNVIWHAGDGSDIERIVHFLHVDRDPDVLASACLAARYALTNVTEVRPRLFAAIKRLLDSDALNDELKSEAVNTLSNYRIPEAETLLETIAREDSYPISAHAILALLFRDRHKYLLLARDLEKAWPEGTYYPGMYVRQLLRESE
jgi:hypothetical protein